nr:MAG TPA: zinc-ribbon domain protein [Caudoviricetes sp.]
MQPTWRKNNVFIWHFHCTSVRFSYCLTCGVKNQEKSSLCD